MKRLILLTFLALTASSLTGCHSCRQMTCGWFNRGDQCDYGPPDCPPGVPRATMMVPTSPQMMPSGQVLPGPIEIAPQS